MRWQDLGEVVKDPYQDLHTDYQEDAELWLKLFLMAKEHNFELFSILWYLRGTGCNLVPSDKHGYRIVPLIGDDSWISEEQYNKEKEYLVPYKNALARMLKRLANNDEYEDIKI